MEIRSESRGARALPFLVVAALGWACAAPRGAQGQAGAPTSAAAPALPACANAGPGIERPAAFPADFPLPPGTVITSHEERSGNLVILNTLVPYDARSVALFFNEALPKAGYTLGSGESEPWEAEANYSGKGLMGRWRARHLPDCPGASTLDVVAAPAPAKP